MGKIKILIADDHAVVREGTRQILEQEPDLDVVLRYTRSVKFEESLRLYKRLDSYHDTLCGIAGNEYQETRERATAPL